MGGHGAWRGKPKQENQGKYSETAKYRKSFHFL
jgi:hypothetical protein